MNQPKDASLNFATRTSSHLSLSHSTQPACLQLRWLSRASSLSVLGCSEALTDLGGAGEPAKIRLATAPVCDLGYQASTSVRTWLPITPLLLRQIKAVCVAAPPEKKYNYNLLWAASCTAFFSFLRSGEITS